MKSWLCAGVTSVGLLAAATVARADTNFTFSLTPTSTNGGSAVSGTGSFALNVPPSTASGSVTNYFAAGDPMNMGNTINSFSSSIGGNTFTLDNSTGSTLIQFTSGSLDDITYSGALITGNDILALDASGLTFTFDDVGAGLSESGNITNVTMTGGTSVTPEPSSLLLLGTGLLGGMGVLRRRLA